MSDVNLYDALSGHGDVVWFTVFRDGREVRRNRSTTFVEGDILILGLVSESKLRAWQFSGSDMIPLRRRQSDGKHGLNRPMGAIRRRWTDVDRDARYSSVWLAGSNRVRHQRPPRIQTPPRRTGYRKR